MIWPLTLTFTSQRNRLATCRGDLVGLVENLPRRRVPYAQSEAGGGASEGGRRARPRVSRVLRAARRVARDRGGAHQLKQHLYQ